ncbi:MAG: cytochrome c biogenesis protein CcsA [Crocinitomicaceae bacterium]
MKQSIGKILSMPVMVIFLFIFFVSIGAATFVENDFGRDVAYKWVYQANWFTLVLIYLSISLIYNIFRYKLIRKEKISTLLFHLSFLIIVLGAGITRYIGFEGVMTIREGEASNEIITAQTFVQLKVHDNVDQYVADIPVMIDTNSVAYVHEGIKGDGNPLVWIKNLFFDHNNYFEHSFSFKGKDVELKLIDVLRNPVDSIIPDAEGEAYLDIVTAGMQSNYIKTGTVFQTESGLKIAFNENSYTDAIRVMETDSGLFVQSPFDIEYLQMADMSQGIIVRDSLQHFVPKRLYMVQGTQFTFKDYYIGARIETVEGRGGQGRVGLLINFRSDNESKDILVKGMKGNRAQKEYFALNDLNFSVGFGSRIVELPFALYLRDFQLDRYPGTMNPSSYASEVTLVDQENGVQEDHRIFMNNVLDYGGYRFFQSSYDPDELGTILSVNHDRPGTAVTYIGYLLLGLGFFFNLFSKHSRFRMLIGKSRKIREKRESYGATLIALLIGLGISTSSLATEKATELPVVNKEHADKFSRLVVQNFNGRFQPVHTLADEVLRKVHRGTSYNDLNPMQVFLGIQTYPGWYQEPIIYVSGSKIRKDLNLDGKYAALSDFIFFQGQQMVYLLQEEAEIARRKKPAERNEYDKDVMKTDERVNVMFGVFNYSYLRIFPKPNDPENRWFSPYELNGQFAAEDSMFISGVMKLYLNGVANGYQTGNWGEANQVVDLINTYQHKVGKEVLLSETQIDWEIWYNNMKIFKRLMTFYITFGLLLLILQFFQIFYPKFNLKWPLRIGTWLFAGLGAFHLFGLLLRWYLSGHAPWSDGYEAVVFISFVTVLAGLFFSRQNKIVLGATGILVWLLLFVAHMNQMDPEITQLVPVLKSYWLMIHVAIITGSYGFLGLGAILSLINLIMYLFFRENNKKRIVLTSKELTYVTEMTITIGLFMLTIGTFLGGVWANESWGRYWGWDAKETWALASVLIYAVVVHLRFVPGLKSQFAFNVASLWAFGSIIMTFFGVNFYLSGLHSYAQGDPIPIPMWVPITVWLLAALTLISFFRWKAGTRSTKIEED